MSTTTEIGSLKEKVTIIDTPTPGPNGRIERIRHANGENAEIDFKTLQELERRARTAPKDRSEEVSIGVLYAWQYYKGRARISCLVIENREIPGVTGQ